MTHAYFVAKARERFAALGGDPDNSGPLAVWAEEAKQVGDPRRGVIVAEDGQLVAETLYHRSGPDRPGGNYVVEADAKRLGLVGSETGLATAQLSRILGQRVVHVAMPEVCRGAGKLVKEVAGGARRDPLATVKREAAKRTAAEAALRLAVADAYTAGANPTELGRAAEVTRQTIYRWLADQGFQMGGGGGE